MTWYALENIEEALQDSKELLLPFETVTWAKLAFIVLFTGYVAAPAFTSIPLPGTGLDFEAGETGLSEYSTHTSFEASTAQAVQQVTGFDLGLGMLGIGILATVAAILIVLSYVTSVFEFVMYRSLMDQDVKISHATDYLFEGLQLFIFRWIATLTVLTVVIGGFLAIAAANLSFTFTGVLTGLLIAGVTGVFAAAIALLRWLVVNFSLPDMVEQENNLLKAFSRTLSKVRANLRQVALFWLVKILLGIALGIVIATVLTPALITALIPFAIIGFLLGLITPLLIVPVALVYIVLAIVMSLIVAVPVRVYAYYYIIEMYKDIFQ